LRAISSSGKSPAALVSALKMREYIAVLSILGVRMANLEWAQAEGVVASVEPLKNAVRVSFTYKVDGHWYGDTFISNLDPYIPGQSLTVRYDPKDPATNDLAKKDKRRRWLTNAAFLVLALIILLLRVMGFR
jgi:hypothetical protein